MPPKKKKKGKSTRTRSATVSDATRRLILQNQYSNAIGRTRSAKGAINAKKKRKKLIAELGALSREDGIEWIKIASKKRRVSRPLTAIRRTREALLKQKQKQTDSSSVDKLVQLIDTLEEAVKPLLVETQRYIESAKESKDRLEKTMQRGVDIDRALLDACGAVFDLQTNYFYATPESQENILPASVFQLSKWHQNTAMKRSNSATGKVSSKNEAQGKRHATMARQDIPDSIVEHRPECV